MGIAAVVFVGVSIVTDNVAAFGVSALIAVLLLFWIYLLILFGSFCCSGCSFRRRCFCCNVVVVVSF